MKTTVALLAAALLVPAARELHAAARKPNVIYLMADELGYFEPGFMGGRNIQTPNMDRMAAEGVRFTQALAGSAVCAPTRGVLMTGKHSGHTSVRSNGGGTPLRAGEETIASMLQRAGYATGGFGKWGCGGRGSTGVPEQHGFDVFFGYYDQVHAHSYYPKYLIRNSEEVPLPGNRGMSTGTNYSHHAIYEQAVRFIRANRDRPFFCYLPFTPPHGNFDIPDNDPAWALYQDKDWPEPARRYAAMVSMVDRQLGEILALLKEFKLDENTVLFLCGDNGGNDYFSSREFPRGVHSANKDPRTGVEFRGKKGNLYEGGLRIPMVVRWPGKVQPGRVSDHLWYFADVMATVAEITGTRAPTDTDGISIVPELIGERAAGRKQAQHEYLYWELGQQIAVRMGNWKAIQPRPTAPWELYDLGRDVSETTSVADRHPEILGKMKGFAKAAHVPVQEGVFHDTAAHERDRQAKFGDTKAPAPKGKATKKGKKQAAAPFPPGELLPVAALKVARVSSENRANGKLAANAIDGDPESLWHTQFGGNTRRHPHELVIDLGATRTVRGFYYLARQDGGWNGAIKDIEIGVSGTAEAPGEPVVRTSLQKLREPQEIKCAATSGRYVHVRALSEVNGGPWASIAEFGIVGE